MCTPACAYQPRKSRCGSFRNTGNVILFPLASLRYHFTEHWQFSLKSITRYQTIHYKKKKYFKNKTARLVPSNAEIQNVDLGCFQCVAFKWQPFTPPKKPWPFCHFHTDDYSHSCVSSFDTDKKSLNVQVKRQQCIHTQAEVSWPFCHSRLIPSIGIQTPSGGKCELRCHGQPVTSILSPSQASYLTRETNNTQWQIYRLRPSGLPAIKPL